MAKPNSNERHTKRKAGRSFVSAPAIKWTALNGLGLAGRVNRYSPSDTKNSCQTSMDRHRSEMSSGAALSQSAANTAHGPGPAAWRRATRM